MIENKVTAVTTPTKPADPPLESGMIVEWDGRYYISALAHNNERIFVSLHDGVRLTQNMKSTTTLSELNKQVRGAGWGPINLVSGVTLTIVVK